MISSSSLFILLHVDIVLLVCVYLLTCLFDSANHFSTLIMYVFAYKFFQDLNLLIFIFIIFCNEMNSFDTYLRTQKVCISTTTL